MAVPDDLLEILICLECRASLTDEGDHLACTGCSLRYPIPGWRSDHASGRGLSGGRALSAMGDLVATLPDQLRWAADLTPPDQPHAQEALVAGMGGSGVAGDIARVVAEAQGARVSVTKTYGLPGWAPRAAPLLVAVSHSGNTEETLSVATAAAEAGLASCAVTRGGALGGLAADGAGRSSPCRRVNSLARRSAISPVECCECWREAGLLAPQAAALREAADVVEGLLAEWAKRSRMIWRTPCRAGPRSSTAARGSVPSPLSGGRHNSTRTPMLRRGPERSPRSTITRSSVGMPGPGSHRMPWE